MGAVVIRKLAKAERQAWTDVRLRALADQGDAASQSSRQNAEVWAEPLRARTRPLVRGAEQAFFVAEDEGTAVGCGGAFIAEDGAATIQSLWTAPAHRGRGIATRILAAIESWAEHRGSHRLVLQVLEGNPAQSLYARAGFRRIEGSERPQQPDGHPESALIDMERRLSGKPR